MNKKVIAGVLLFSFVSLNVGEVVGENKAYTPIAHKQVDLREKWVSDFQKNQRKIFRQKSNIRIFTLQQIKKYGWNMNQYSCLYRLWKKESNWRWNAHNKNSGAYGIPQATPGNKMRHEWAGGGKDWKTNPRTQITWGLSYIKRNHGSPCVAWQHSGKHNWY